MRPRGGGRSADPGALGWYSCAGPMILQSGRHAAHTDTCAASCAACGRHDASNVTPCSLRQRGCRRWMSTVSGVVCRPSMMAQPSRQGTTSSHRVLPGFPAARAARGSCCRVRGVRWCVYTTGCLEHDTVVAAAPACSYEAPGGWRALEAAATVGTSARTARGLRSLRGPTNADPRPARSARGRGGL